MLQICEVKMAKTLAASRPNTQGARGHRSRQRPRDDAGRDPGRSPRRSRAGAPLKRRLDPEAEHDGVAPTLGRIEDGLDVRLERQERSDRHLVGQLDDDLVMTDGGPGPSASADEVVAQARVGPGEAEDVLRAGWEETE